MEPLAATTMDPRFRNRACPACGGTKTGCVLNLPADSFCAANPTYTKDYPKILNISENAIFPIVRCASCKFVFAAHEPNSEFLKLIYDEVIGHSENIALNENARGYAVRMRYVADLLNLAPSGRVHRALDFGCGLGVTLRILEAANVQSIGFDNSEVRSQYNSETELQIVRSMQELSALRPFDIIVCDNVLEHLPNPADTLRFLATIAAPNSILFVSVPNCDSAFFSQQKKAMQSGRSADMALNPWEHLNYFDLDHLDRMLSVAGFLPIADVALPNGINVGLRSESNLRKRMQNAMASSLRVARYALTGRSLHNPNRRFYRLKA